MDDIDGRGFRSSLKLFIDDFRVGRRVEKSIFKGILRIEWKFVCD